MRNVCLHLVVVLFLSNFARAAAPPAAGPAPAPATGGRQHLSFDFGWLFSLSDPATASTEAFDDGAWRKLDLPHDWSIELPFDQNVVGGGAEAYLPTGTAWYRKHFKTPDSFTYKQVSIQFDGVFMNADVYLNGKQITHHSYGYTSFSADLTAALKPAGQENVVAVRVDNSLQPNSRWYSGSGIYRHVWIDVTGWVRVAPWGNYVTTPRVTAQGADVQVASTVINASMGVAEVTIHQDILDPTGKVVGSSESKPMINRRVAAVGNPIVDSQTITVPQPQLWSLEKPTLYTLRTRLTVGGVVTDQTDTPFGIRSIEYDLNKGFMLNGQHVKMLGECLHADGGPVGVAVPEDVWERRLKTLKSMGCNAIRCSHCPPAPEFLDLCDQLGILVMDEAFDEWTQRKNGQFRSSYASLFNANWQADIDNMLIRDRNHPSVVIWSVGNEIGEQRAANGPTIIKMLVDEVHKLDPTRPTTAACDNAAAIPNPTPPAFMNVMDIAGYNYVDRWGDRRETFFEPDKIAFPQRRFIGTEDAGVGGVRGSYAGMIGAGGRGGGRGGGAAIPTAPEDARPGYTASMIRAEQLWKFNRMHDYVVGYFMWTGIDYLGEAGWPNRSASSGALDLCGFPKDAYYFYESIWTDAPMVHLLPQWTWTGREGNIIPVIAYSNCDTVELSLNGKSFGTKALAFPREGTTGGWNTYTRPDRTNPTTADLHLSWDVPYAPGTLKAVGKRRGTVVATEEIKTAGPATTIKIATDKASMPANSRSVMHIETRIFDDGGTLTAANNAITYTLEGPATLIGIDNGNPASHASFKTNQTTAFNGMCLAMYQSTGQPGHVKVTAHAEGLKDAVVEFDTLPAAKIETLP